MSAEALEEAVHAAVLEGVRTISLYRLVCGWEKPSPEDRFLPDPCFYQRAVYISDLLIYGERERPAVIAQVVAVSRMLCAVRNDPVCGWQGERFANAAEALVMSMDQISHLTPTLTVNGQIDVSKPRITLGTFLRGSELPDGCVQPTDQELLSEFVSLEELREIKHVVPVTMAHYDTLRQISELEDPTASINNLRAELLIEQAKVLQQFYPGVQANTFELTKEEEAILLLRRQPNLTNVQIAKEIDVHNSSLSRWDGFKKARKALVTDRRRRGYKDKKGTFDTWEDLPPKSDNA